MREKEKKVKRNKMVKIERSKKKKRSYDFGKEAKEKKHE